MLGKLASPNRLRPIQSNARTASLHRQVVQAYRVAGPGTQTPDYTEIDRQPLNAVIMQLFRNKLVHFTGGVDSALPGYAGVIELTKKLHRSGSAHEVQERTRQILKSLFPSFLPPAFSVVFSKPMPKFAAWMNAWATWFTYVAIEKIHLFHTCLMSFTTSFILAKASMYIRG